jgi:hypothetical protein
LLFGAVGRAWPRRLTYLTSYLVGAALIHGGLRSVGTGLRGAHRIAQSAIPVGALLAGIVVQAAGLIPTIVGMGVVYVLVVIGMFFNPRLRDMEARHEAVSEPTDGRATGQDGESLVASRRTEIR